MLGRSPEIVAALSSAFPTQIVAGLTRLCHRPGVGWKLAAWLWRHHLPHPPTDPGRCAACGLPMPCPGWRFADWFLADSLKPRAVDEPTRELPHVEQRPRLPKRQPGTHLQQETRYG